MSIHADPKTEAEKFARYLELNYGLQLDSGRHGALLVALEAFAADCSASTPAVMIEPLYSLSGFKYESPTSCALPAPKKEKKRANR